LGIAHRSIRIAYVHKLRRRKWFKPLPASIKTLAEWIQVKRREKNLSPYHLATKMGIATTLVQSWETGICQPDGHQRQVLCGIFGCDSTHVELSAGSRQEVFIRY
jgi:DNA-binding transcriptional regulator YiaG